MLSRNLTGFRSILKVAFDRLGKVNVNDLGLVNKIGPTGARNRRKAIVKLRLIPILRFLSMIRVPFLFAAKYGTAFLPPHFSINPQPQLIIYRSIA